MASRMATRWFLAVVVVFAVVGNSGAASFASEKAQEVELSKALGQAKLFARLTDEERTALKSAAALRHCKTGESIIEQGKTLDKMFILLEGQAQVKVNGKLVATLPEHSVVGELEFLDKFPASAEVVILKDALVIELNNAGLISLMTKQPRLGYVVMSELATMEAQRLRAMNPK